MCDGTVTVVAAYYCIIISSNASKEKVLVIIEKHHVHLDSITAVWLVQLVKRQSAVLEVEGCSPVPDQYSGS